MIDIPTIYGDDWVMVYDCYTRSMGSKREPHFFGSLGPLKTWTTIEMDINRHQPLANGP